MAVPVPHTWAGGEKPTSANMQTLTDTGLYTLGSTTSGGSRKPFCQLRQTVSQSPATGVWTAITFDTEDFDYDASHSTVTNTDRFTAATTGLHLVSGGIPWTGNVNGRRGVRYTKNGTAIDGSQSVIPAVSGNSVEIPGRTMAVFLTVGDILRMEGFQDGVATLATVVSSPSQATFTVWLVSN